jgi:nucleotide-binding universal stress UspA family protein
MMKKILVGLDGSQNSFRALEEALKLAKLNEGELHTISVEELPYFSETVSEIEEEKTENESKIQEAINKAKELAAKNGYQIEPHILSGHGVKVIIDFVNKHKIDLLIIGFVGRSALYDRVMGSTSLSLVRLAPCSVYVVK